MAKVDLETNFCLLMSKPLLTRHQQRGSTRTFYFFCPHVFLHVNVTAKIK